MVFRFESVAVFSAALAETTGSLPVPEGETVSDGEWVLATFEIGSRKRATAAAARAVRAAGDVHLEFERRDWDRLVAFTAARSEHMRAARPASSDKIPVAAPVVPPPESAPVSEPAPPSSALYGARILLVDDDAATREGLRAMLAEIGLVVELCDTASEADARMRQGAFDALILDFHASGLDPLAFVRELRRDPARAPIPVLFLSNKPTSRDVVDAFASGADDFLPKPFRAPELGARIFGLLRRARLTRPSSAPDGLPGPSGGSGNRGGRAR